MFTWRDKQNINTFGLKKMHFMKSHDSNLQQHSLDTTDIASGKVQMSIKLCKLIEVFALSTHAGWSRSWLYVLMQADQGLSFIYSCRLIKVFAFIYSCRLIKVFALSTNAGKSRSLFYLLMQADQGLCFIYSCRLIKVFALTTYAG